MDLGLSQWVSFLPISYCRVTVSGVWIGNCNCNLFQILIDPDTGIGYRMSHSYKVLVPID
jgi:hypothetical protein